MLQKLRNEIKADLATTLIPTHTHLPDQIHPPLIVIEPGEPYIADSPRGYGRLEVAFDLHVLTDLGTEEIKTTNLDQMIETVIHALDTNWTIGSVRRPFNYVIGQRTFYSTVISITTTTSL